MNAKLRIRSGWINLLTLGNGSVTPPTDDYKITSFGDFTFAYDGVRTVRVQ